MKILFQILVLCLLVAGCDKPEPKAEVNNEPPPPSKVISVTTDTVEAQTLRTVEHDEHWIICYGGRTSQSGVAIIHHPECPRCTKKN